MKNINQGKFIFFIQFGEKLPDYYFTLAAHLSRHEVHLVPIKADKMSEVTNVGRHLVLGVVDSMINLQGMMDLRSSYLNFAINSGRVLLVELSSFRALPPSQKIRNSDYIHLSLPLDLERLASFLSKCLDLEHNPNSREWPGGKRSRLPNDQA
jgi:hypothetical protein